MYNKVDTNMNFVEREKKTEQFWRENNIFRKSMENRKEGETYTFDVYNPEKLVISQEEPLDLKVKLFYAKLSAFEKALLEKRRAGLKLQEIADEFNCDFLNSCILR